MKLVLYFFIGLLRILYVLITIFPAFFILLCLELGPNSDNSSEIFADKWLFWIKE